MFGGVRLGSICGLIDPGSQVEAGRKAADMASIMKSLTA